MEKNEISFREATKNWPEDQYQLIIKFLKDELKKQEHSLAVLNLEVPLGLIDIAFWRHITMALVEIQRAIKEIENR